MPTFMGKLPDFFAEVRARRYELRDPLAHHRHGNMPRIVEHRFPIKGGLTFDEAMRWHCWRQAPKLLERMMAGRKP